MAAVSAVANTWGLFRWRSIYFGCISKKWETKLWLMIQLFNHTDVPDKLIDDAASTPKRDLTPVRKSKLWPAHRKHKRVTFTLSFTNILWIISGKETLKSKFATDAPCATALSKVLWRIMHRVSWTFLGNAKIQITKLPRTVLRPVLSDLISI
jgi:hypothetical protein